DTRQNSEFCILHIDLPEDESSEEFREINELKEKKVEEKVSKEDFNFEGARLLEVDFSGMKITLNRWNPCVNFTNAIIRRDAKFDSVEIVGSAWFREANIGGNALFREAKISIETFFGEAEIGGHASFEEAEIGRDAWFGEAKIGGNVLFGEAKIGEHAFFGEAKIGGDAWFGRAKIGGDAWFGDAEIGGDAKFRGATIGRDAWFGEAKIGGNAWFDRTKIGGKLEFKGTTFKNPKAQEDACRTAKNIWENLGDKDEADYYYYYREMEAKRKQKSPIIKFLELPIQYIFGYGVYPYRVIATWLFTVFCLAFVYWVGNGVEAADSLSEYIYFSVVTAATPGYGGYHPKPGIYQVLSIFEAIFGTFMWAAFIAIFARKYMR
ncbi:MAG: potassium channel family protein, partial [Methanocellales archaeon]|nr:potassium channel family protein [Methanocellales archaeon]